MEKSLHKIEKQLRRELQHLKWLKQNLLNTEQYRESKRQVFRLYTERALAKQATKH